MNPNNNNFVMLAAVPLAAILIIFIISQTKIVSALTPMEKRLLNFSSDVIPKIPERKTMQAAESLKSPIAIEKIAVADFPETPLRVLSPPVLKPAAKPPAGRISMILVNSDRRLAVIDGRLINEGDVFDQDRVLTIEKNRVLLKGKEGEKWLQLD